MMEGKAGQDRYDVCIVGAGVAGSSLAFALGKQGRKVVIIERDLTEPDRIIGELLQPGGVQKLEQLGCQDVFKGLDSPEIEGYAIFKDRKNFSIKYPKSRGVQIKGRSFRYGKFIMRLRQQLTGLANVELIEGSATDVLTDGDRVSGIRFKSSGKKTEEHIRASLTIVCDGGSSLFREELSNAKRMIKGYFLGLVLEDCPLPYPNHGHVFIAGRSPFLSYPTSSRLTRVLIDFPDIPPKGDLLDSHMVGHVLPRMPEQMHESVMKAVKENPFRAMPNCEVVADPIRRPGAVLLGDALNMRHPLTGGGMTVALSDVKFITDLLQDVDLNDMQKLDKAMNRFYDERHLDISTINILANALYGVLSHPELSQACFDYMRQGGRKASEPIELLSALSRNRKMLLSHFMAVARSGASRKLLPIPTPRKIREAQGMINDAIHIIQPQLKNEQFGPALDTLLRVGGAVT